MNNISSNLDLNTFVPNYINCSFPHVALKLKQEGLNCELSYLSNLQLVSIPLYTRRQGSNLSMVDYNNVTLLNYPLYEEYLNVKVAQNQFNSYENGLDYVKTQLKHGEIVTVSGTRYYAPYSSDYLNEQYIDNFGYSSLSDYYFVSNHWISILEISSDSLFVYDPIPSKYIGTLSEDSFKSFWMGDRGIATLTNRPNIENSLSYGFLDITTNGQKLSDKEMNDLMVSTFKTISYEFNEGKVFNITDNQTYFGYSSTLELISDLHHVDSEQDEDLLNNMSSCLFNLRRPRLILKDLVADLVRKQLINETFIEVFTEITENWNHIYNMYAINLMRKKRDRSFISKVIKAVESTHIKEKEFHEAVCNKISSIPILIK